MFRCTIAWLAFGIDIEKVYQTGFLSAIIKFRLGHCAPLSGYTQSGTGFQPVVSTRTYEPHRNLITAIDNSVDATRISLCISIRFRSAR